MKTSRGAKSNGSGCLQCSRLERELSRSHDKANTLRSKLEHMRGRFDLLYSELSIMANRGVYGASEALANSIYTIRDMCIKRANLASDCFRPRRENAPEPPKSPEW